MHTVLIYGTREAVHSALMARVVSMGYRIIEQHIALSSSFSKSALSFEEKLGRKRGRRAFLQTEPMGNGNFSHWLCL